MRLDVKEIVADWLRQGVTFAFGLVTVLVTLNVTSSLDMTDWRTVLTVLASVYLIAFFVGYADGKTVGYRDKKNEIEAQQAADESMRRLEWEHEQEVSAARAKESEESTREFVMALHPTEARMLLDVSEAGRLHLMYSDTTRKALLNLGAIQGCEGFSYSDSFYENGEDYMLTPMARSIMLSAKDMIESRAAEANE